MKRFFVTAVAALLVTATGCSSSSAPRDESASVGTSSHARPHGRPRAARTGSTGRGGNATGNYGSDDQR